MGGISRSLPPSALSLLLLLLVIISIASADSAAQRKERDVQGGAVDDSCQLRGGGAGVCRYLESCNASREALDRGEAPTVCSYKGTALIVCCPLKTSGSCKTRDGRAGVCRSLVSCNASREALEKGEAPVICSYDKSTLIVCCPVVPGSKANTMCKKYAEAVFVWEALPLVTFDTQYGRLDSCQLKNDTLKIGSGFAGPNEFPHMALLGYVSRSEPEWGCSGSLISERYILTPAHCLLTREPVVVRLGEFDYKRDEERDNVQEDFGVERVIPHPDFINKPIYNNIGLIKLDRDVNFTRYYRPACLNTQDEPDEGLVIATGWKSLAVEVHDKLFDSLKKIILPLVETRVCKNLYPPKSSLNEGIRGESMICAGDLTGGSGTCQSDRGAPLQKKLSTLYCMYSILGVNNFGQFCGGANAPEVFNRVSHFVPWIENIVWPGDF